MKNYQNHAFSSTFCQLLNELYKLDNTCKSTKHTSLTAESDPMFYFFSLDLLMVFLWAIDKKQEYGIIIWEFI